MGAAIARDARTESYRDLKGMLSHIANGFISRYNTDADETHREAQFALFKWYAEYDINVGVRFSTYIYGKVWNHLLEWHRTMIRRHILGPRENGYDLEQHVTNRNPYWLTEFLDELSDDARLVANMAITTPNDLKICLVARRGNTPTVIRSALSEVLTDLGWTAARIAESFTEIGEALR